MGGISHHHLHPWALQNLAFLASLIFPAGIFAILIGSWRERLRRAWGI